MDEEFDGLRFDIVGDLNLEGVRWVGDEQPHFVPEGPVNDDVKNVFYGLR